MLKVGSLGSLVGRLCYALIKFDLNCIKCVCTHTHSLTQTLAHTLTYTHILLELRCTSYCLKLDFVTHWTNSSRSSLFS